MDGGAKPWPVFCILAEVHGDGHAEDEERQDDTELAHDHHLAHDLEIVAKDVMDERIAECRGAADARDQNH